MSRFPAALAIVSLMLFACLAKVSKSALRRYMTEHLTPSPFLLSVAVHLVLASRDVRFDVSLRPTCAVSDLRQLLKDRMRDAGRPVSSFAPDSHFVYAGQVRMVVRTGPSRSSGGRLTRFECMPNMHVLVARRFAMKR
jgi:hypothetical protein